MRIELAPMEGITTYIYRNALYKYFGGIDTYFSPFISVHKNKKLNFKEKNDILPENNNGMILIPQVMASDIDEFLYTSSQISDMGYTHINFNFGCPSGTVTSKGKGAGALLELEKLKRFLDGVFTKTDFKISVKTRIGFYDQNEWPAILEVYSQFPIEELIIHGRVREEYYKAKSRLELVAESVADISDKIKISYNGDIATLEDFDKMNDMMPWLDACMIGRGIISNPALASKLKTKRSNVFCENACLNGCIANEQNNTGINIESFKAFNMELLSEYSRIMSGDKNCMLRIKELWFYMSNSFVNSSKILKMVQKSKSVRDYELIIHSLKEEDLL